MTGKGRPQKANSLDTAEKQGAKKKEAIPSEKMEKSQEKSLEGEPPKVTNPTKKGTTKTKPEKRCEEKAELQSSEEMTQKQPEAPKDPKKDLREDKTPKASVLKKTLEKLKIKPQARSDASEVVNKLVEAVSTHLKKNTKSFEEVERPLPTGSYYENLKISDPDEFDVMMPIPVERVIVEPFGDDGAFYSVALKRGNSPLKKFQEEDILSASKMLEEFRDEIKKCAKDFPEWKLSRKKKRCPAVTLTTEVNSVTISLDVVLCIMVKSQWPLFTTDGLQIEKWQGTKEKQAYRRKPYYLVPKYQGRETEEKNGVLAKDTWRVSFSHVEKDLIKKHGSEKTCCETGGERCCRKACLKLLKHLLSLLKEEDSSFDEFYSYTAKTTLLHACSSRAKDSDWKYSDLSDCFQLLLQDYVENLEKRCLPNFFIPSQNLLCGLSRTRCNKLARRIQEECNNGFPIFEK
ncbi:cyclic GMP-AMP synthase [Xyrichtys novacula]|uniref:Cyclic GMP-AMP synthase n=1 Tax=Xyrichtys novacula TaxID=13765 RepID=A0AAV1FZL6_XYRNO|nr:cyclic GMP-AMP synthase [Xyrichtys novacula]